MKSSLLRLAVKYLLAPAFCMAFPQVLFSQGTQTAFGQNRVQYKHFEWSYFETERFVTFFYLGGQDIGKYVIQFAEKEVSKVEEALEYKINKRIEILVYNDLSDLNQTNIGQSIELNNTGGLTKVIENKMFVYFDGNHQHLEKQIRQGIAQIFIQHIVFGGNLQEILQNAVLLNLPPWFTDGLVDYVGQDWSSELDNKLRDGVLTGKYRKFNKLSGEEAKFAGHALWHYVEEKYGKAAVPNLLYLTRINRSIESGFLFVLGGSVKTVLAEWFDYYYNHYQQEKTNSALPVDTNWVPVKRQKKYPHYQVKLSADGKHIAYATNNSGRYKIRLIDYEKNKTSRVMRGGIKTISLVKDFQYPLLSWSPDGKTLGVIYEKRDHLFLRLYNFEKGDRFKQSITKFQQIHSFAFTDDPRYIVMSASNRGQSDIYTYHIPSTTTEQLTNDYYDDIEAGFVKMGGKRGIIFLSNRNSAEIKEEKLDTILPGKNFDLYFYNLGTRTNELVKITNTPYYSESLPVQLNDSMFAFLSDDNGVRNRYAGYFESAFLRNDTVYYFQDSTVTNPSWKLDSLTRRQLANLDSIRVREIYRDIARTFPITDLFTNIIEHDVNSKIKKAVDMHLLNQRLEFFVSDLTDSVLTRAAHENSFYQNFRLGQIGRQARLEKERDEIQIEHAPETPWDTIEAIPEAPFFQSDFNTAPEIDVADYSDYQEDAGAEPVFKLTKVRPYQLKFSTDGVVTNFLDNTMVMTRYQKFTPGSPSYEYPELGIMNIIRVHDLFENHIIDLGFKFPYDSFNPEVLVSYQNLKKRLDKKVSYYRHVIKNTATTEVPFYNIPISAVDLPVEYKQKTNYFEVALTYPFDVIKSLRGYIAYRHENYVFLSKDDLSHRLPNYPESWLFGKIEYVHDHTVPVGLNLLNGLRFKIFAEIHKEVLYKKNESVNIKLPDFNDAYFGVVGVDFRYYQKVVKNIVWANRFAWSSSFGNRKVLFYLGGVDSWIRGNSSTSEKEESTTKDLIEKTEGQGYAFQANATNLRGFPQNARYGNSFVLFNTELRVPVFSVFNNTIKSEFVKNFQVVAFTDVGTAWVGTNPWNKDNPLFTEVIGQDPVTVTVEYYKNPIIFGFGFGLRTSLFGYFVRFDVGWGIDSGQKTEEPGKYFPRRYFSFTTDF